MTYIEKKFYMCKIKKGVEDIFESVKFFCK